MVRRDKRRRFVARCHRNESLTAHGLSYAHLIRSMSDSFRPQNYKVVIFATLVPQREQSEYPSSNIGKRRAKNNDRKVRSR